ncbi:MAG: SDR family NAD(P)-dependent oxidoreductase [Gemmatimonadota bacterium]
MQLTDQLVLVTGGASGIGAATARMVVAQGGRAAIVDVDRERGEALAAELGAQFVAADVGDDAAVGAAVAAIRDRSGPIRGLVHCAGIGGGGFRVAGPKGPHPLDLFTRIIGVNLVGTFSCVRHVAQAIHDQEPLPNGERGVIVTTASIVGNDGPIGASAYAASKVGVMGLTLPFARDLGRFGIRVCCISPGSFDTPLLAGVPPALQEEHNTRQPFPHRAGRPEEFAGLVRHIFENPFLNGETIRLDAGFRFA